MAPPAMTDAFSPDFWVASSAENEHDRHDRDH